MATKVLLVLCLIISAISAANQSSRMKIKNNNADLLKDHVDQLATKEDTECKLWREDVRSLFDKIDSLSSAINQSKCYDPTPAIDETSSPISMSSQQMFTSSIDLREESAVDKETGDGFLHLEEHLHSAKEAIQTLENTLNEVSSSVSTEVSEVKSLFDETATNRKQLANIFSNISEIRNGLNERIGEYNESDEIRQPQQEMHEREVHSNTNKKEKISLHQEECQTEKGISVATRDRPKSCLDWFENGARASGEYNIYPNGYNMNPMRVFCDHDIDGGGWTVFQRRKDGTENFQRQWQGFKNGFGKLEGEFWLGNEFLSILTSKCCRELRVELEDFNKEKKYAKYNMFQVESEDQFYMLKVGGYSGNAGDALTYHNGSKFTTKDLNNGNSMTVNCARTHKGAWWYNECSKCSLNAKYRISGLGIYWYYFHNDTRRLKFTEMKFR